jgi:sialic acid synthase
MLFMPREFRIGDTIVNDESDAYIISDLSHNHLGSVELCREMIRLSAEAGVSAVKLQKRGDSTYKGLRKAGEGDYADLREKRELFLEDYWELSDYAHSLNLHFLATAFDQESANFLMHRKTTVDAFKIASGDVTNTPLLEYVAKLGKPMIVSTGGATEEDVFAVPYILEKAGCTNFALLHCTSEYPVKAQNMNLKVIQDWNWNYEDVTVGFSSHVHRGNGPCVELMAYVLGARIFEKHFTITPDIGTGEHAFAMTPVDMSLLCQILKKVPLIMGNGVKGILKDEATGILRLGKHLVYDRDLVIGEYPLTFSVEAPGNGIPPNQFNVYGHRIMARCVEAGDKVMPEDFQ